MTASLLGSHESNVSQIGGGAIRLMDLAHAQMMVPRSERRNIKRLGGGKFISHPGTGLRGGSLGSLFKKIGTGALNILKDEGKNIAKGVGKDLLSGNIKSVKDVGKSLKTQGKESGRNIIKQQRKNLFGGGIQRNMTKSDVMRLRRQHANHLRKKLTNSQTGGGIPIISDILGLFT